MRDPDFLDSAFRKWVLEPMGTLDIQYSVAGRWHGVCYRFRTGMSLL